MRKKGGGTWMVSSSSTLGSCCHVLLSSWVFLFECCYGTWICI